MSIKEEHLKYVEDSTILHKKIDYVKKAIAEDESGSCWHKSEVIQSLDKAIELSYNTTSDEKVCNPLSGVLTGVKDLFCVKGMTTTAGSKILENFISPYDSSVWKGLKDKGAILSVKCSMDEFAMGSFSNTSFYGKTSMPGKPDYTAGGSSGGSASSILAGLCDFSIGSDTGGSVRQPASFCSLVGYKPSYGAFSRFGMISYASSLDQAGFMTKSLDDLKYILSAQISLADKQDMTCKGLGIYTQSNAGLKKVGYFPEILEHVGVQKKVKEAYSKCLDSLKAKGIETIPVSIEFMDKVAEIYYIIACSEASSNLSRYQGIFFGKKLIDEEVKSSYAETISEYRSKYFGIEVQRRIMLGSFILSAENFTAMYQKACLMRDVLSNSITKILDSIDCLVLPTSPTVALKWDEIQTMTPAQIYMSDFMTVPFSLSGVPAISVPLYKEKDTELGIGMQFVGNKFDDYLLIDKVSNTFESSEFGEKI